MMFGEQPTVLQRRPSRMSPELDEHPGDRVGPGGLVEDAHLVVVEAHVGDLREARHQRLAQRQVEGVDRAVALGGGVMDLVADAHLDRALADHRPIAVAALGERDEVEQGEGGV